MGSSASSHTERAAPALTKTVGSGTSIEKEQQSGVRGHTCMRSVGSEVDLTKIIVKEIDTVAKDKVEKGKKVDSSDSKDATTFEKEEIDEVTIDTDEEDSDSESFSDDEIDEDNEVEHILQDAAKLNALAQAYLHPEKPVITDPSSFGRNFFDRASAPDTESFDDAEERARILADTKALKDAAVDYMHPEVGVTTADGATFGRNYFNRPSAFETEDDDLADERADVLAEMEALKKLAVDYMHPEIGVKTTDGAAFGRNYFNRPSAVATEDDGMAGERAKILAEAKALKKLAIDYHHPEVGVTTADGATFGRNYFNRPSAFETEDDDLADERADVLAEMKALKKLAVDFMHPENGVKSTDGAAFGRNYFNRPSAVATEDDDMAEERAKILAEAKALKKLAIDYHHPEVGVTTADGATFGRNYFNMPSAVETEDYEFANERVGVLNDMSSLKQLAVNYMHPEVGINVTDGAVFGRNYFGRASAQEIEDNETANERAYILADKSSLKRLAVDYLHPEVGVETTDGAAFGRNYFGPDGSAVFSESTSSTMPAGVTPIETNVKETESHASSNLFDFEEEYFDNMRATFSTFIPVQDKVDDVPLKTDEEEGNLSRSPSSVMLFGLGEGGTVN